MARRGSHEDENSSRHQQGEHIFHSYTLSRRKLFLKRDIAEIAAEEPKKGRNPTEENRNGRRNCDKSDRRAKHKTGNGKETAQSEFVGCGATFASIGATSSTFRLVRQTHLARHDYVPRSQTD